MRKRKKYDITFIPIPTELYKGSELYYLLVKILEKRQKIRKKSWKNGRNTLFFIGKVEKTINPKAIWQHSLRPNLDNHQAFFHSKTISKNEDAPILTHPHEYSIY